MEYSNKHASNVKTSKQELVEACKVMLSFVKNHSIGTPDVNIAIQIAEQAIADAEVTGLDEWEKSKSKIKTAHFGTIGKHYDFMITIVGIHSWGQDCFVEGSDRSGHKLLFRIENPEDWVELEAGEVIVIRGHVLAHDKLLGEQITYVETSSVPTRI